MLCMSRYGCALLIHGTTEKLETFLSVAIHAFGLVLLLFSLFLFYSFFPPIHTHLFLSWSPCVLDGGGRVSEHLLLLLLDVVVFVNHCALAVQPSVQYSINTHIKNCIQTMLIRNEWAQTICVTIPLFECECVSVREKDVIRDRGGKRCKMQNIPNTHEISCNTNVHNSTRNRCIRHRHCVSVCMIGWCLLLVFMSDSCTSSDCVVCGSNSLALARALA